MMMMIVVMMMIMMMMLKLFRLGMKTTDVNWTKAKDDRITDYYKNKQMKFINPGSHDYSRMSDDRPHFASIAQQ